MISTSITPWSPKLAALIVPSVIGGMAFWFFVQQALRGHVLFTTVPIVSVGLYLIFGLLCLALWLGPIMLSVYVSTWHSVFWALALLTAVPLLVFFPLQVWTGLAVVVTAVALGWGTTVAADDAHNRLLVQPLHSLARGITFVIFGVMISISLLYYQQLRGQNTTVDQLATRLIDQTVTVAERALPLLYNRYEQGMTVDQLIGAQLPTADSILQDINFSSLKTTAEQQSALNDRLSQLGLDSDSIVLSPQVSEQTIRRELDGQISSIRKQTIDQTREELGRRFDITITADESVHDVLAAIVGRQFNRFVRQYVTVVPALLALALFFVLRFATSLFQAMVVWGGWVWLRLLRATKLIIIEHQTVPAERSRWRP